MNEAQTILQDIDKQPSDIRKALTPHLPTIGKAFDPSANGHIPTWREALEHIPTSGSPEPALCQAWVSDGTDEALDAEPWRAFHPWRKGPYRFGSLEIDTEWRSDLKWDRLSRALGDLNGLRCLDVGCGNGYHLWRMRGSGAELAMGLEPYLLYVFQFLAAQKRLQDPAVSLLPLADRCLESFTPSFDRVFSMGVLYHAADPHQHLTRLRQALRPDGQLILETLVVPESHRPELTLKGRYACMRNIRVLPDTDRLLAWVKAAGFREMELVDVTVTTGEEQRATEWMRFHSLSDFLMPGQPGLTVEGHPAPRRALVMAKPAS